MYYLGEGAFSFNNPRPLHSLEAAIIGDKVGLKAESNEVGLMSKYDEALDAFSKDEKIGILIIGNHLSKEGGECLEYLALEKKINGKETRVNFQSLANKKPDKARSVGRVLGKDNGLHQIVFKELEQLIIDRLIKNQISWLTKNQLETVTQTIDRSKFQTASFNSFSEIESEIFIQVRPKKRSFTSTNQGPVNNHQQHQTYMTSD